MNLKQGQASTIDSQYQAIMGANHAESNKIQIKWKERNPGWALIH